MSDSRNVIHSASDSDPNALKNQMSDAFLGVNQLLLFACQNAISPKNLDDEEFGKIIGRIVTARNLQEKGQLDEDKEVQFFNDFHAITTAFSPVTIGSIRDTKNNNKRSPLRFVFFGDKISRAAATVRRFSLCAIITLLLLLYVQIIWVTGTSIIGSIQSQLSTISDEVTTAETSETQAEGVPLITNDNKQLTGAGQSDPDDGTSGSSNADLFEQEINREKQIRSLLGMLEGWSKWNFWIGFGDGLSVKADNQQIVHNMLIAKSTISLDIYKSYFLPLLYGLMGACCFMLRRLIVEVRGRVFRSEAEMSYWLRLFLGMLAGLAIGWFLRPELSSDPFGFGQSRSFLALTPLALSFVAGYSVELLFAAMDRLIDAFKSGSEKDLN